MTLRIVAALSFGTEIAGQGPRADRLAIANVVLDQQLQQVLGAIAQYLFAVL